MAASAGRCVNGVFISLIKRSNGARIWRGLDHFWEIAYPSGLFSIPTQHRPPANTHKQSRRHNCDRDPTKIPKLPRESILCVRGRKSCLPCLGCEIAQQKQRTKSNRRNAQPQEITQNQPNRRANQQRFHRPPRMRAQRLGQINQGSNAQNHEGRAQNHQSCHLNCGPICKSKGKRGLCIRGRRGVFRGGCCVITGHRGLLSYNRNVGTPARRVHRCFTHLAPL